MKEEMKALEENETYKLVTLPENRKAICGRWAYIPSKLTKKTKTHTKQDMWQKGTVRLKVFIIMRHFHPLLT